MFILLLGLNTNCNDGNFFNYKHLKAASGLFPIPNLTFDNKNSFFIVTMQWVLTKSFPQSPII